MKHFEFTVRVSSDDDDFDYAVAEQISDSLDAFYVNVRVFTSTEIAEQRIQDKADRALEAMGLSDFDEDQTRSLRAAFIEILGVWQ